MGISNWVSTFLMGIGSWLATPFSRDHLNPTITFLVGMSAFIIYKLKIADKKRSIAKLILLEMGFIELQAKQSNNTHGFDFFQRLLPSESWSSNKYLFVNDFSQDQIDTISAFYAMARDIDFQMDAIAQQINDSHLTVKIVESKYNKTQDSLLNGNGSNHNSHTRIIETRKRMLMQPMMNSPIVEKFKVLSLPVHKRITGVLKGKQF